VNRLPRQPKPSPEKLAEAIAALPRADMNVGAAPELDEAPATLTDRIYAADVMKLADWLRAAIYALREKRLRIAAAWDVFGYEARPQREDLEHLAIACEEQSIDTAELWEELSETRAVELARELQRKPLVATKLLAIKHVWDPT
jgi:hypothetical protein